MPIPHFLASRRAAIMTVFAAFGTAVGALAGSIPAVTRAADIDSYEPGLAITGSTLCTVTVMSFGGSIARYASNRVILLWGIPVFAAMMFTVLTSTSAPVF